VFLFRLTSQRLIGSKVNWREERQRSLLRQYLFVEILWFAFIRMPLNFASATALLILVIAFCTEKTERVPTSEQYRAVTRFAAI
jgi:hypothetical protein